MNSENKKTITTLSIIIGIVIAIFSIGVEFSRQQEDIVQAKIITIATREAAIQNKEKIITNEKNILSIQKDITYIKDTISEVKIDIKDIKTKMNQ